MACKVKQQH